MTRVVPLQMRRRGVETRPVLPGKAVVAARTDPGNSFEHWPAYQWFANWRRELRCRPSRSQPAKVPIAVRPSAGLPALLAPAIVECICAGRQSVCPSAERLKTQAGV